MVSDMANIDKGMDVYDVNGVKIGAVDEVWSGLPDESTGTGYSGGGSGVLGDESEVRQDDSDQGALGDESGVYRSAGAGGGTQSLGDESAVTGSTAGTGPAGVGGSGPEGDVVVVEEVVGVVSVGDTGTDTGGSDMGYFKVDQGGILGFGAKHLYIPFSAVQNVIAGDRVILSCTKDEADAQYDHNPAAMG